MLKISHTLFDLTHLMESDIPTWGGACDFKLEISKDYDEGYRQHSAAFQKFGVGTHIDAPSHFCIGGQSIHELALEHLVCEAHVLHLENQCHDDYEITLQDVLNHEKEHGKIHEGTVVIFHTGWDQYWKNPKKYRNASADGHLHFPAIHLEVAEYLVQKKVVGMGIDTLSPETGKYGFPIHHLLLGHGMYILENLTNCGCLPPTGAQMIALPLKARDAGESPLRVIALVPKDTSKL